MEGRMRFVARLLEGKEMSHLVPRVRRLPKDAIQNTLIGSKEAGLDAFTDQTRQPFRYGIQLPFEVEAAIVQLNNEKSHWGRPEAARTASPAVPV